MPRYQTETPVRGRPSAIDPMGLLRPRELRQVISHSIVPRPIGELDWTPTRNLVVPRADSEYFSMAEFMGRSASIRWNYMSDHTTRFIPAYDLHLPVAHTHRANGINVRVVRRFDDSGFQFRIRFDDTQIVVRSQWDSLRDRRRLNGLSLTTSHPRERIMSAVYASMYYSYDTIREYHNSEGKCTVCNRRSRRWICRECNERIRLHAPTRTTSRGMHDWSNWGRDLSGCDCFTCYGGL